MKVKCKARVHRETEIRTEGYLKKLKAEERFKKLQAMEVRRSPRLKLLREKNKHETPEKKKRFNWDNATTEEIAERLLCDYNKKHGTKLEFVGLLAEMDDFHSCGYFIGFEYVFGFWKHFNFEARRVDAEPSDKPLVLFAELMQRGSKSYLITMSIVKPGDESNRCIRCTSCVIHPRQGFRAGFIREPNVLSEPKMLSEQAAAELSEFVLQGYNKKHGTTIRFERALKCNSFTCSGLSMDFSEKNTNWVHMNFEVRVGRHECVVCLFAELYLGDDGEYVLATLSPAAPAGLERAGDWKKKYAQETGCVFCPPDVLHPCRAYRFAFDYYPRGKTPTIGC